jgi:hypothetical protein
MDCGIFRFNEFEEFFWLDFGSVHDSEWFLNTLMHNCTIVNLGRFEKSFKKEQQKGGL